MNKHFPPHLKHEDLKSGYGWVFFILGIMLALFLGGALRVALAPKRLQSEVSSQLAKAKVDITVEGLELSLHKGMWPRLGLASQTLRVLPKSECDSWSEVVAENLYLPITWQNGFTIREIRADNLRIILREKPCDSAAEAADTVSTSTETKQVTVSSIPTQQVASRWQKEVQNFQKYLDRVEIAQLTLEKPGAKTQIFEKVQLSSKWPVKLQFDWKQSGFGVVRGELNATDEKGQALLTTAVKEGSARAEAFIDFNSERVTAEVQLAHWPLNHLFGQLNDLAKTDLRFTAKSTWLTCNLAVDESFETIKALQLKIKNCRMDGALGRAQLVDYNFIPSDPKKIQPFQLQLNKIDVHQLLQALGREGLSGTFTKFGYLTGEIIVRGARDMQWRGELRDLEAYFSNRGARAYQKISVLKLDADLALDRWKGRIFGIELAGGNLQGEITFDLDEKGKEGWLQVQVPLVDLSSEVQKVMVGGELDTFGILGRAKIVQGKIATWQGDFGAKKIRSYGLNGENLRLRTQFAEEKLQVRAQMASLEITPSSLLFDKFKSFYLDGFSEDNIRWVQLESTLFIDRYNVRWQKLMARDKKLVLASSGEWRINGGIVDGEVDVDVGPKKMLKWQLTGKPQKLILERVK